MSAPEHDRETDDLRRALGPGLEHLLSWHAGAIQESTDILLSGVPLGGGILTRPQLALLIREAFLAGIAAQLANPVDR